MNEETGPEQNQEESAAERQMPQEPDFIEPSRIVSYTAKGVDYLDYQWISDRLVFTQKLTMREKDNEVLKLALACLRAKMLEAQKITGSPFIQAEALRTEEA